MLKEQKGITLVALIITIIVMLILAGVSISLVVGEDGVLSQAQSVEPAQIEGALKEAVALANADMIAAYYGKTTADNDPEKIENIEKYIQGNFSYPTTEYTVDLDTTNKKLTVTPVGESTAIVTLNVTFDNTKEYYKVTVSE